MLKWEARKLKSEIRMLNSRIWNSCIRSWVAHFSKLSRLNFWNEHPPAFRQGEDKNNGFAFGEIAQDVLLFELTKGLHQPTFSLVLKHEETLVPAFVLVSVVYRYCS